MEVPGQCGQSRLHAEGGETDGTTPAKPVTRFPTAKDSLNPTALLRASLVLGRPFKREPALFVRIFLLRPVVIEDEGVMELAFLEGAMVVERVVRFVGTVGPVGW